MPTRPKILLTNAMHPEIQEQLAMDHEIVVAPDTQFTTLNRLIEDVDGLIVRSQLPPDIFEHATRLRAVVRHGVGLDMIPVAQATIKKIPVANLPGSNSASVAEFCLAAMLHFRRRLSSIDQTLRSGGWAKARPMADTSAELTQSVCGIVGVGAIGSYIANITHALGMQVLGLTRSPNKLPAHVQAVTKTELFQSADVIVLSCPLNDQTRGLVDQAAIALMKPNAILINVARGPVVDTTALISALKAGRIAGAALDVHDQQPLNGKEPSFDCPNLLLTPHVAAITDSSMRAMSRGSADTLRAILRGERPANICNPEIFSL